MEFPSSIVNLNATMGLLAECEAIKVEVIGMQEENRRCREQGVEPTFTSRDFQNKAAVLLSIGRGFIELQRI